MQGSSSAQSLLLALATVCVQPTIGTDKSPLDIAGIYDQTHMRRCKCWGSEQCECVHDGCEFVERFSIGSPDEDGYFDISLAGQDRSCFNGTFGPFQLHVDHAGRVMGGAKVQGHAPNPSFTPFNPLKLEQELNFVLIGNVFGFAGNPADYRAIMIDRYNVTVCDTDDFISGSCKPGQPRYTCRDTFAYCAGGKCAEENLEKLSPKEDEFFSKFSATALNGTYTLSPHESSPDCPKELSVFQFGSQLGIGASRNDMHMARVVDTSMAWKESGVVQFQTQCSGLQWHMDMAVAGEFEEKNHEMEMTVYLMLPWHDEGVIEVEKCVMRAPVAPRLFEAGCNHTMVVVLVVLLMLALIMAGGLAVLFKIYYRKYVETKITRQYEIFQG